MRKLYTLCVAMFFMLAQVVYGQTDIASYAFSSSIGTYTPITGTTWRTGTWDSEISPSIPLGGTFTFGGVDYTSVYITANGWISFGSAPPSSSSIPLSSAASSQGVISAYANDGANSTVSGSTPVISYENIGGATGEFVVQFQDHARYANRSTERLNFQIRLNLDTDEIKVIYGSFTPSGSSATTSQVGIRGNSTTYSSNVNNLMLDNIPSGTSCNWANAITGNANNSTMLYSSANTNITIPNGLTFTWTPQSGILPVRTFSAVSNISQTNADISWTAPAGATQYNVQYRKVGECNWTNFSGNPVSGTTATITGLDHSTTYQVRVQASDGTNNTIWSHIPNAAGTGNGYALTGTFTTLCAVITAPTAQAEPFNTILPTCWSGAQGIMDAPTTFTSTTTSNWVSDDFANVVSNGKSAKINIYGTGRKEWLISPSYDLGTGGNMQIEFDLALTVFNSTNAATLGSDDKFSVLISTDDGATWTSANVLREWNSSTAISNTGEHIIINLSAYTGIVKFAFYGESTVSGGDYDLFVDNFEIKIIPACASPLNVVTSGVTSTGATIAWDPSTSAPISYDVYYSELNTAPDGTTTPSVQGVTGTTTNVTGLTPQTTYYVWVRSNCGASGLSDWSIMASFTTPCAPFSTLNENFDGLTTTGVLPECWNKIIRGSSVSSSATVGTSTTNYSPSYSVALYNSGSGSSDDIMLVSPELNNLMSGTHRLRFYARASSATQDLEIGTLDNNTSSAVFTPLQTVDLTTSFQEFVIDFNVYAGTDPFIGFRRLSTSTYTYVYIDNIVWEPIPSCIPPTDLTVQNITTTGASIMWSPSVATPVDYQVYYATTNTAPDATTTPTLTGVSGMQADLTGLTPGSTYYVWVRSNCGTEESAWSTMLTFNTACVPVVTPTAAPETFTTYLPSICWQEAQGPITGPFTNTTTSSWGQANFAHVSANGAAARLNIYGTAIDEWLITPVYDLGTAGNLQLEFDLAFTDFNDPLPGAFGSDDRFVVLISTDDGNSWMPLREWNSTTPTISHTGEKVVIDLSSYNGLAKFAFFGESTVSGNGDNDIFIDNLAVTEIPACAAPTGLVASAVTATGATITWDASLSNPAAYELYYSATNTAPDATTSPSVSNINTTTTDLTGLTPTTTYYVWVRSACGASTTSDWSSSVTFVTDCVPVSVINENLDGLAAGGLLPECWGSIIRGASVSSFSTVASSDAYAYSGTYSIEMYNSSSPSTSDIILVTPQLDNLVSGTHRLRFFARASSASQDLEIGTLSDKTAAAVFTPLQTVDLSTAWQEFTVNFNTYFGPDEYIGIRRLSTSTYTYVYVDDIVWEQIPSCMPPTDVVVSNLTANAATVQWTPAITTVTDYQVYYSDNNTAPDATTVPTMSNITTTQVDLTGLTSNTTYHVWVRSNCGAEMSSWTPMASFTTLCDAITTYPYTQGFDASTMPSCFTNEHVSGTANWTFVTSNGNGTVTPRTGTRMAEFRTSTRGNKTKLVLPMFNLSTISNPEISFYMANVMWSPDIDELRLYYKSNSGDAWTQFGPDFTTENATWTEVRLPLPNPSATYQIALEATSQWARGMNIDDLMVGEAGPLPVTLTNFTAEKQGTINRLSWTTLTEQNNAGFEVQRGADGRNFSKLAFVTTKAPEGNSTSANAYALDDVSPMAGANYYRLKQLDKDGKATYSQVVMIKGESVKELTISSVYPNPAINKITVRINTPGADKVNLVVTDITGRVVMQQAAQMIAGDNLVELPVQSLSKGTYMIKAICADGCQKAIHKFVKQ